MLKTKLIRLMPLLLTLFVAIPALSQETQPTPTTPSAVISPTTAVVETGGCDSVSDCLAKLDTANRRIQKAVDAYEHAIAAGLAKDELIAAQRILRDLLKEGMAIKDQFIADLKADNEFLRKTKIPKAKSTVRKIFDGVVKFLVFVAGVKVGQGL
jgi:hypothetical protein